MRGGLEQRVGEEERGRRAEGRKGREEGEERVLDILVNVTL